jgi:hypothetical protein
LKYDFCKTYPFLVTKISLETLANMLITQSGNFQNFEFESLAGISLNTWQTKMGKIVITVKITAPVRLMPVAMLIPLFSLSLSLRTVRSLGACAAAFQETPTAVGAAAGARWRS